MPSDHLAKGISVRGTEIRATEERHRYREKIARVTLDSMVQFVGLLDAEGTVLEINKVALDAVGLKLSDVEGKPFWTTFWWQVSPEINQGIRDAHRARSRRASSFAGTRRSMRATDGSVTIIIDASVMPGEGRSGQGGVPRLQKGATSPRRRRRSARSRQKNIELQGLLERIRELDEIKTQFFANVSHELLHLACPDPRAGAASDRRSRDDEPGRPARGRRRSSLATPACS